MSDPVTKSDNETLVTPTEALSPVESLPQTKSGKLTIRDLLSSSSKPIDTELKSPTSDTTEEFTEPSELPLKTAENEPKLLTERAAATALPLLEQLANKNQQAQVLADKAALLLGLARQFESSSRGQALQEDAQQFLDFANEIRDSAGDSDIVRRAQSFADAVMDKYEAHGKTLFAESQKTWDELMGSTEAEQLIGTGQDVLREWLDFGDSERGKELVKALQDTIFSSVSENSEGLLSLAEAYSTDADAWLNAMEKNKASLQRGFEQARLALEEDPELTELLEQGKRLVEDKATELENAVGEKSEKNEKSEKGEKGTKGEKTDTIASLSQTAQEKLTEIQKSEVGKQVLKKGGQVLQELQKSGDLAPDAVIDQLKKLQEDPLARQVLVTKVKDAALEFLLGYLPEVNVPPLEEDNEKCTYSLSNIDLSGFKVKSEDVDVELTDAGVTITAKNIQCVMKKLNWTYKAKKFPYVGSKGDANAHAVNCSIRLILEVERTPRAATPKNGNDDSAGDLDAFLDSTPDEEPAKKEVDPEVEALKATKIVSSIDEVLKYDYALVLVRERTRKIVEMPFLEIEITNNWLSSVINVVLQLLRDRVREYVEKELNLAVLHHSGRLLTTINEFATEYLPLFAAVKDKVVEKAPKFVNIASQTISEIQENVKQEAKPTNKTAEKPDVQPAKEGLPKKE